jgi:mannose 2-epimerase
VFIQQSCFHRDVYEMRIKMKTTSQASSMPGRDEVVVIRQRMTQYLTETLLPFWLERSPDREHGGFLTYFDRDGRPTGETTKTFLMQVRILYTMASAHRAGYGNGKCAVLARRACSYLLEHYWDDEFGGWFWIADSQGRPTNMGKIGYGHCFALYAFSEYYLATGDVRGRRAAEQTYRVICEHMVDTLHGGYFEILQRNWQPEASGPSGGDRKSLDVHMHMMEALTSFYEMTAHPTHRRRLLESIDIILKRMLRPGTRTGYMQFTLDFTPLPAILFNVGWGRDAKPEDGVARPVDLTSYGHNVELIWLLLHAADILGQSREEYRHLASSICDHAVRFGLDVEYGGVFIEGPEDAPPSMMEKQFWQQAEMLVGMLDTHLLLRDEKFWNAFRNVYDFVFEKFVNLEGGGEWFERVDRKGNPIDDSLAHGWKISYHTVRSMVQAIERLKSVEAQIRAD